MPGTAVPAVLFILAVMSSLSGCATIDTLGTPEGQSCGPAVHEALAKVDWRDARAIEVDISSGEFSPMILDLRRGRPYRLIIANRDSRSRVFHAASFFHRAALADVREGSKVVSDDACIEKITLPPGGVREARLVPLQSGRYELGESALPIGYWGSGLGVISVN
jgi:hypothetical protein